MYEDFAALDLEMVQLVNELSARTCLEPEGRDSMSEHQFVNA